MEMALTNLANPLNILMKGEQDFSASISLAKFRQNANCSYKYLCYERSQHTSQVSRLMVDKHIFIS